MKKILVLLIALLLVPLSVSAQDFCEGNFDCDSDVDGTDAAVFKEDFGRSTFKNPCPDCPPPAPVPKTGQTTCYNDSGDPVSCQLVLTLGQDGNRKGVSWPNPRFTDNLDGTVTDNLTGLIWLKNADCFGPRFWQQAIDICRGLETGSCGLTDGSSTLDWRLPNKRELFSLTSDGYYGPAVPSPRPFTNIFQNNYWSSTTFIYVPDRAWYVFIFNGSIGFESKTIGNYVWCVRGEID